mgnify:CR=1 FL=1
MARKIHYSRLLDFLSGSALAAASTTVQRGALTRDFDLMKLESKKLRELIDANLPTFYVVNVDTIVKELSDNLGFSNFSENAEYVQAKYPSKKDLINLLQKTIDTSLNTIKKDSFTDIVNQLNTEYIKLLNTFDSSKISYAKYRNATAKFAFNMRSILKKAGVFIASDGAQIVNGLSSNSYVIIGPSFNSTVELVNKKLNDSIRSAVKSSYDLTLKAFDAKADAKNRFTIGDYINAGHTAAYGVGEKEPTLIGVNMPFAQEKQFQLSGDPKAEGLETELASLYLETDYAIKFNQNFIETATSLLNMQFSFTITMPTKFNQATLRTKEVDRIKRYIGDTILPTVAEQAKKKFVGGLPQIVDASASPSTREFIEQSIKNSLQGNKVARLVKQSVAKKTDKKLFQTVAVVKKPQKLKLKTKSGGINIESHKLPISVSTQQNLTSLQNILNATLAQQIRQNMGDGNRTDVLNYRTGRFANSAIVERLTQGREGMITAYYNYMKYPYATFSEGGRQEFPRSRDPKLLISKSIREILQQQMITKMRAVLV